MNDESKVIKITSKLQFDEIIQTTDSKKLIIVDFSAHWCSPCSLIWPIFVQLANMYPESLFLTVDVDIVPDIPRPTNALPTFQFFKDKVSFTHFSGSDSEKLYKIIRDNDSISEPLSDTDDDDDNHGYSDAAIAQVMSCGFNHDEAVNGLRKTLGNVPLAKQLLKGEVQLCETCSSTVIVPADCPCLQKHSSGNSTNQTKKPFTSSVQTVYILN